MENLRREKLGLFNRADKLAMIGANILVMSELLRKWQVFHLQ